MSIMLNTGGGSCALCACEVVKVPLYSLLAPDKEKALNIAETRFAEFLAGFHRNSAGLNRSMEIIYLSHTVMGQTYRAGIKMYLVLREYGSAPDIAERLDRAFSSLLLLLGECGYIATQCTEDELEAVKRSVQQASVLGCQSVARLENAFSSPFVGTALFSERINSNKGVNTAELTNLMSQYPGCVVSLSLIPTVLKEKEIRYFEIAGARLGQLAAQAQLQYGVRPDPMFLKAVSAFDGYQKMRSEQLFYFLSFVCGEANAVAELSSKLIGLFTAADLEGGALLKAEPAEIMCSPKGFMLAPWRNCNAAMERRRNQGFPEAFLRMKYVFSLGELRSALKLPVDDKNITGVSTNRVGSNREQFANGVIAEDNFKLGTIQNSFSEEGKSVEVGVNLDEFTKHCLVLGMSGTGKTYFLLGVLLRLWKEFHIPFLAVEPTKAEYRSLIEEIPNLNVFTPGKSSVSPFILNPFLPPKGVAVETYIPSLLSAFQAAFTMPDPLPAVFTEAINTAYNQYGWKLDSTIDDPQAEPFGFYEFIQVFRRTIRSKGYDREVRSNMETAGVLRLMTLIEQNGNIYDTTQTIPIDELLKSPTLIELNAVTEQSQKALIMALMLIQTYLVTLNGSVDGKLKNILLIDEAHVLIDARELHSGNEAVAATIKKLQNMVKEVRSYGTGIIIGDQSAEAMGNDIIGNTNVKVLFRLAEKNSKDIVRASVTLSDADYEALGMSGVGEALLSFEKLNGGPLHIKTPNLRETYNLPQFVPDEELAARMGYWKTHGQLLVPYTECAYTQYCAQGCDFNLRTDAEYLASRLKNQKAPGIKDKKQLAVCLVSLDDEITKLLEQRQGIEDTPRLRNCVKIKLLRKLMLSLDLDLTAQEYKTILNHTRFLSNK